MDLGTQGAEQCLLCRLLHPGLTRWQGPREEWNRSSNSLFAGKQLSREHSDGCYSGKDPGHVKETKILRRVGPRKVITKWYLFCWASSVHQIFYSTKLQWSAPESWFLDLASNHTDLDCARRDHLPNWHIRCSDEMLRATLNKPLFAS